MSDNDFQNELFDIKWQSAEVLDRVLVALRSAHIHKSYGAVEKLEMAARQVNEDTFEKLESWAARYDAVSTGQTTNE